VNKSIILLLLLTIWIFSCKNSEKGFDKLDIAKKFYIAIDNSNPSKTKELITENFTTKDDGFEQKYSGNEYAEWIKWDSIFQPTYEIIKIEQKNGTVSAKISKIDKRISFLHQEPIITNEIIQFENNKITNINRVSASFNVERFVKRRDELVSWIAENHPELNGFLNDQTITGGKKYMKAIELYRNRK
jgi:hypothetical protein